MASYISTPETFFIGDYAEFLFLTDQVVSPSDISVFMIQHPLAATLTGTMREPFCCLTGTQLQFAADGGIPLTITFDGYFTYALDVVNYINSFIEQVSGTSGGFYAATENGFVTIKSKTTGFTSSLSSLVANTQLGFTVQTVSGSDQQKVTQSPDITVNTIDTGEVAVTFPVTDDIFKLNQVYYIQVDDGVNTFVKHFKVIPGNDYVSVNFVG